MDKNFYKESVVICILITCLCLIPTTYILLINYNKFTSELKVRVSKNESLYTKFNYSSFNKENMYSGFITEWPKEHELFNIIKSKRLYEHLRNSFLIDVTNLECKNVSVNFHGGQEVLSLVKNPKKNEFFLKFRSENPCFIDFLEKNAVFKINEFVVKSKLDEVQLLKNGVNSYKSIKNNLTVEEINLLHKLNYLIEQEFVLINVHKGNLESAVIELIEPEYKNSTIRENKFIHIYSIMLLLFFIVTRIIIVKVCYK